MEWTEVLVRLAIAAGLCAAVGLERELRGQPAGIRTHTVVGIGSALFTIAGAYGFDDLTATGDPGRIAAQVASGVGFLGAGVILRHGLDVRGLTTAATLWLSAALGVAAGAGMGAAAAIASGLVIVVLFSARYTKSLVERRLRKVLKVRYEVGGGALGQVVQLLEESTRYVGRLRVVDLADTEPPQRTVWVETEIPNDQLDSVLATIRDRRGVLEVTIDSATFGAD
jgi:putative Mg2+ transporter-C (MgtC) family protein